MDPTLCALNRFGLGARPGERQRARDPRTWLARQLEGGPPLLTPALPGPGAAGTAMPPEMATEVDGRPRERQNRRLEPLDALRNPFMDEVRAALSVRVTSDRPFVERLVAFWSNHFCVSTANPLTFTYGGLGYERDAIRPHVLGRFEDLVMASARHPAMLVYLDNWNSIGPTSAEMTSPHRGHRGFNENYARELLELHTVGVDGGYTQQDVEALGRILTGWGIYLPDGRGPRAAPATFRFRPRRHEPGSKTVLGVRYEEAGVAEGERAIRALCRHTTTAAFVARKLVTHFVSDDPPPAAVERVADAFRRSDGDLKVVAQALVDAPEAWTDAAGKFRTPQDWLVAVLRALGASTVYLEAPRDLAQLRHAVWGPSSPKGYGDRMPEWADPDSLLNRGELARRLATLPGIGDVEPLDLLDVINVADAGARNRIERLMADETIARQDRVALAIAGPAFQWR